ARNDSASRSTPFSTVRRPAYKTQMWSPNRPGSRLPGSNRSTSTPRSHRPSRVASTLHVDQAGRTVVLGADRRYTGPDCPADMLDLGGIPQGDYAPLPWLLSSRGWA